MNKMNKKVENVGAEEKVSEVNHVKLILPSAFRFFKFNIDNWVKGENDYLTIHKRYKRNDDIIY